jgi:chromosomal replication initiation ATPase DnaA
LAPDADRIKKIVCQSYNIDESELLRSRRGVINEPRNVAIYLTRRLTGDRLMQIADQYGVKKYSSVSSVIERMNASIAADRRLRERIEKLHLLIVKSQEQT